MLEDIYLFYKQYGIMGKNNQSWSKTLAIFPSWQQEYFMTSFNYEVLIKYIRKTEELI